MRIIPVLDLKDGEVVRAERGRRESYRPIVTPLSRSSDAVAVAEGLRGLYDFRTFYIADIDAIEGRTPDRAAQARLKAMPDAPELWVDAAFTEAGSLADALDDVDVWPVLGSESQTDADLLRRFRDHPRLILSLDFFAEGYRGPVQLIDQPEIWPRQVIVMTLAQVGAGRGPDFARLKDIKAIAGNRAVIAAGGVRDEADIRALAALGIEGALVATSLHDGTLTPVQLAALCK